MKALEIFIGLFFVYLVLSTLVTAISELLIARCNTKAKVLRQTIRRLFANNQLLEQTFFNDPEIRSLIDPKRLEKAENKKKHLSEAAPSSLKTETFVKVLLRILGNDNTHSLGGFQTNLNSWVTKSSEADETKKRQELADILSRQVDCAASLQRVEPELSDIQALTKAIGEWYDESMERSRGIFRRIVQKYVLLSALAITILLNADTIRIVQALSNNEEILNATVTAAYGQIDRQKDEKGKPIETAQGAVEHIENSAAELENVGVPLGWDTYEKNKFKGSFTDEDAEGKKAWRWVLWSLTVYFFLKFVGLGATAIAASLGAPFWYDILNKLAKVRGAISPKAAQNSGNNTSGPSSSDNHNTRATRANGSAAKPAKSFTRAFSEQEESFDIDIAYWMARCSKAAYLPLSTIGESISKWGLTQEPYLFGNEDSNDSKGTQGFITATNECIVISFRGTETKEYQDILTDIDLDQDEWNLLDVKDGPKLSVHGGFKKAYLTVRDQILTEVKRYLKENPNRSVWFTGHSLGAALATLCATDLMAHKVPIPGLYTYGSPRTGNKDFADYLAAEAGENIFRFVNEDDPVTELPLEAIQDYCHVGKLRYLDRFNRLKIDRATWSRVLRKTAFWLDVSNLTSSRAEAFEAFKTEFSKRGGYHSIDAYVDKIASHSGHSTSTQTTTNS